MATDDTDGWLRSWTEQVIQISTREAHTRSTEYWTHTWQRGFEDSRLRYLHLQFATRRMSSQERTEWLAYSQMMSWGFGWPAKFEDPPTYVQHLAKHSLTLLQDSMTSLTNAFDALSLTPYTASTSNTAASLKRRRASATVPVSKKIRLSPRSCRLLQLPAELRNSIYEYALVKAEPIKIKKYRSGKATTLLGVCRQIYQESTSIYYHGNTFEFDLTIQNWRDLSCWLDIIGDHALHIRELTLRIMATPTDTKTSRFAHKEMARVVRTIPQAERYKVIDYDVPNMFADIFVRFDKMLADLFTELKSTSLSWTSLKVETSTAPSQSPPPHSTKSHELMVHEFKERSLARFVRNPDATSYHPAPYTFPTLDEVAAAIPPEGIKLSVLLKMFDQGMLNRHCHRESLFCLVRIAGKRHPTKPGMVVIPR